MRELTPQEAEPLLEQAEAEEQQSVYTVHEEALGHYPAPSHGFNQKLSSRYVILCALFSALGGLVFGYDQGVVSVILVEPQFLDRFWQVADTAPGAGFYKGFLTAMIEFGALLGAFNQGWLADRLSRKHSIVVAAWIFVLGSILQTIAYSYLTLVLARFIGGLGIGMLSMVVPLYISEISPPEIRGSLLVLEELSIVIGIVVAFWITYATRLIRSEWAWRLPFALQTVPGLLLGIGIYYLPFSPRWLVSRGREKEALQTLSKLRQLAQTNPVVLQEWCEIRTEVALHREVFEEHHPELHDKEKQSIFKHELTVWKDLFRRGCLKRTHVGMGIMFFQQFVGINALVYYAPTMLKSLGLDYDMQLIMSGVINMAQLAGVISSIWTMDRVGRRMLLICGSSMMFLCHFLIAILVGNFSNDWAAHAFAGWLCVAFLLLYMLAFGSTWGPVPWALPSEIFPSYMRAKGVAASACSNWLNNFIVGLITPPLVQNSRYGAYLFFAFFCMLSLLWTYFFVPETAGKSLEEMDHLFGDFASERQLQIRQRVAAQIAANTEL